ncbi:UDP-2,3-diacylglucosamine hydrolase [Pseudoalteromonas ulvae UL12]|uniref:UDP-2,3-diacylglucosamine hydrolase n=1 Tax=Pseudoalteromonas ulvae TaxID=107327 RepID=A0A244CW86_PSEDV|nr:UDP-2,3-diacylglucosamine diphosphatase [Pseudoalteromonas ulvae]MBE0362542.1 UDP-2,3-diacylglucosamine hydrolase [Pseudoalteromonas ulvae UL12]OUL59499.1 UDP-2,3-diacylglucosamine diphosphatase [Pseudoalteromonas ulvae]
MRNTLFISDLHLSDERPDISSAFFSFLDQHITAHTDALYILGDFFEVWVGDDYHTPLTDKVAAKLHAISQSGIPIFFVHGNRDFLIGKRYAEQCAMTLLPEQSVIDLYGEKTVILHGDEMCTDDLEYQQFRKKSRGWWWPKLMLSLPLWYRQSVAKKARAKSKLSQQGKEMAILDVTQQAVDDMFALFNVKTMIHGHTHRPDVHQWTDNNQTYSRIVLGDWYHQGSYLIVTKESKQLLSTPFS